MSNPKLLPNFFIIGASKAGSTSLNHYLDQHPDIFMGSDKEPEFFQKDEDYSRGLGWYVDEYFGHAKAGKPIGEASASYLYYTKVAERLRQIPKENQRFIVTLRSPVDRAYSQYWHQVRNTEFRSFQTAIAEELSEYQLNPSVIYEYPPRSFYLGRSLYASHLKNYFNLFPREAFLIIFLEELVENPQRVFKKVCEFLEVDYVELSTERVHNSGTTNQKLLKLNAFRKSKFYEGVLRNIFGKKLRRTLYSGIKKILNRQNVTNKYPELSKEMRLELTNFFSEDVKALRSLIKKTDYQPDWLKQN